MSGTGSKRPSASAPAAVRIGVPIRAGGAARVQQVVDYEDQDPSNDYGGALPTSRSTSYYASDVFSSSARSSAYDPSGAIGQGSAFSAYGSGASSSSSLAGRGGLMGSAGATTAPASIFAPRATLRSLIYDENSGTASQSSLNAAAAKAAKRQASQDVEKGKDAGTGAAAGASAGAGASASSKYGSTSLFGKSSSSSSSLFSSSAPATAAPQLKVVNGKVVVMRESLVQNVATGGPIGADGDGGEEEEEVAGPGFITSATYAKRSKADRWTAQDSLAFYQALRYCGTDFSMINTLFPKRDRTQIKKKFQREQLERPALVGAALKMSLPFDLASFQSALAATQELHQREDAARKKREEEDEEKENERLRKEAEKKESEREAARQSKLAEKAAAKENKKKSKEEARQAKEAEKSKARVERQAKKKAREEDEVKKAESKAKKKAETAAKKKASELERAKKASDKAAKKALSGEGGEGEADSEEESSSSSDSSSDDSDSSSGSSSSSSDMRVYRSGHAGKLVSTKFNAKAAESVKAGSKRSKRQAVDAESERKGKPSSSAGAKRKREDEDRPNASSSKAAPRTKGKGRAAPSSVSVSTSMGPKVRNGKGKAGVAALALAAVAAAAAEAAASGFVSGDPYDEHEGQDEAEAELGPEVQVQSATKRAKRVVKGKGGRAVSEKSLSHDDEAAEEEEEEKEESAQDRAALEHSAQDEDSDDGFVRRGKRKASPSAGAAKRGKKQ